MPNVRFIKADLNDPQHQEAILTMLNIYAMDPMGDGKELSENVRTNLIPGLRKHPTSVVILAMHNDEPVGIAICFLGFSTFAAKPLLNIHDFCVAPSSRGQGIARDLLAAVEREAKDSDCCKLTLEVQERNHQARRVYRNFGFAPSRYAEEAGDALFLSKLIPR